MRDEGTAFFGECRHAGLLWGLESVAWSPNYFPLVVPVLVALEKIDDHRSKWVNRPLGSLGDCFLPDFPQTHADASTRLDVFDALIAQEPEIAWKIAEKLIERASISASHQFRWRDAGGDREPLDPVSNEDYRAYLSGFIPKLGTLASASTTNLCGSIIHFQSLPRDVRRTIVESLKTLDKGVLVKEERESLRSGLRSVLNRINSYGDQEMREDAPGLNQALAQLDPEDVIERVGWIMNDPWPKLPEGESEDYQAHQALLAQKREEAARELLDNSALDDILVYANNIQYIELFGHAIGRAVRDEHEDAAVLDAMLQGIASNPRVVIGYAIGRVEMTGPSWVNEQLQRLIENGSYSPEQSALIHMGLPEGKTTWSAVAARGSDVEQAYWNRANGFSRENFQLHAPIAVEKLLNADRPIVALDIASQQKVSVRSVVLKRLLEALLSVDTQKHPIHGGTFGFHVAMVFKQLYERNELSLEEIARLEWPFAAAFEDLSRHAKTPLALHRLMQKDFNWFVELISFTYKNDDGTLDADAETLTSEQRQSRARNARAVLTSWHLIPGISKDGDVDESALNIWVDSARQRCADDRRVTACDLQIAEILARAPADTDGAWPHIAVRNVIERLKNQLLDKHIWIALRNNRGVVSRSLFDGGKLERSLAEQYNGWAAQIRAKWPRTAAILRSLAQSYEAQAHDEDVSAHLLDLK